MAIYILVSKMYAKCANSTLGISLYLYVELSRASPRMALVGYDNFNYSA